MLTIKRKVLLIMHVVKDDVLYIFYVILTSIYKVKLAAEEVVENVKETWTQLFNLRKLQLIPIKINNKEAVYSKNYIFNKDKYNSEFNNYFSQLPPPYAR